jgi:hypothetical protein
MLKVLIVLRVSTFSPERSPLPARLGYRAE